MVEQLLINVDDYDVPDANRLVTEDDTPVDNFASAKQQRLLVGSLYSSLQQMFLAEANVGIYHTYGEPPIVPDVFVSFDVQVPENWWEKQNRCYLVWRFGKSPEVAIEIVSNQEGEELGKKLRIYEHIKVNYYIIYDQNRQLGEQVLRVYALKNRRYVEVTENWLEDINLGVTLSEGEFEGRHDTWLRWCYQDRTVLPTGDERAQQAERRVQLLAERLRALGVDPHNM
ncbi:Uma2 family endonuclease [Cylindrospermum sp. FACHB-282]|uniref:Uma2 family endonuclease n=1 Tax=Cylindrospermum sp. FACHB-282 TaxID=2692794 RepID=UPI00168735CF|nr:Uma2 family endonuclease [Cylindrospermum sp. FACHB-282]MBD2384899.1 Uma2 family endonuclease [Cylindrospermum sp. FACHB-282]